MTNPSDNLKRNNTDLPPEDSDKIATGDTTPQFGHVDPTAPPDVFFEDLTVDEDPLIKLQKEFAAYKDHALRALAEAENSRKRAEKDREDAFRYGVVNFAREIVVVADNIRRALDIIPQEARDNDQHLKNLVSGLEAVERDFLKAFEKSGIKPINPMGEMFNPNMHEVMFEIPGDAAPGTIVQVLEQGYMIYDRLLRPARVAVSSSAGDAKQQGLDTEA